MKKRQSLITIVMLFCVVILGFSVNAEASNKADSPNAIEVSAADSLSAFNYKTPFVPNEFQPGFYPVSAQRRYSLKITNNARWSILRLYMSNTETERWGPDQLGNFVLRSGDTYTITDIVPGEYDVMFVDRDGDKCALRNIQIFKNESWTITSSWLVNCQSGK